MKLLSWSLSDPGRRRPENEDSMLARPDLGLFAVADGMGGHRAGATASRMAVEALEREVAGARRDFAAAAEELLAESRARWLAVPVSGTEDTKETEELPLSGAALSDLGAPETPGSARAQATIRRPASVVMRLAARKAGASVFTASAENPDLRGMGTTLTAALFDGGRCYLAHIGDSRAYLLRDGSLRQLTEDHSWISEQVRAGLMSEAEASESRYRHVITRSIGFDREVELDADDLVVQAGDVFLLCSDGLSSYVDNDELEAVMARTFYREIPAHLVALANERGGDDNITVVVVYAANSNDH